MLGRSPKRSTGDLLLVLAPCWKSGKSRVVSVGRSALLRFRRRRPARCLVRAPTSARCSVAQRWSAGVDPLRAELAASSRVEVGGIDRPGPHLARCLEVVLDLLATIGDVVNSVDHSAIRPGRRQPLPGPAISRSGRRTVRVSRRDSSTQEWQTAGRRGTRPARSSPPPAPCWPGQRLWPAPGFGLGCRPSGCAARCHDLVVSGVRGAAPGPQPTPVARVREISRIVAGWMATRWRCHPPNYRRHKLLSASVVTAGSARRGAVPPVGGSGWPALGHTPPTRRGTACTCGTCASARQDPAASSSST